MNVQNIEKIKIKKPFFPYERKIKLAYFTYLRICMIAFSGSLIFSLFATINVAKYQLYDLNLINVKYNMFNLWYTPIFCLFLLIASMILLIFVPKISNFSAIYSSLMFYFAFGFLTLGIMLSSEVQLTYIFHSAILNIAYYHGINPMVARILIIISIFLILVIQVFFQIMRRKFTFMNSDY